MEVLFLSKCYGNGCVGVCDAANILIKVLLSPSHSLIIIFQLPLLSLCFLFCFLPLPLDAGSFRHIAVFSYFFQCFSVPPLDLYQSVRV